MDSGDPTALLLTKIRSLEPDYAPKIIGYLLLQDFGERDLLHLARGPESILQSIILKVKAQLGIYSSPSSSSPSSSSTPTSPSPFSRPPINGRVTSHSNGFMDFRRNSPSPSSSPSSASPWSLNNPSNGNNPHISPKHNPISKPLTSHQSNNNGVSSIDSGPDAGGGSSADLLDDQQLSDYLSFLDDSCSKTEDVTDPRFDYSVDSGETHLHRRSFSADASFVGSGDDGFGAGCKPCVYFSRGLCKNGDSCKFIHGGYPDNVVDGNGIVADSPRKMENFVRQHEEMMRLKLAYQQQRLASQILGRAPQSPYDKRMDFLLQQHAQRDGGLPFGDERYWSSSPGRLERMELMAMQFGDQSNSVSRQIYLTFPADSTFKDEDVATYFSLFGTVQDVRIPYQQKRMFGFVSFAHPETVKVVLARGNPHFICDSRVLVKPYKEKGKVLDKKQQQLLQQQIERGNYSPCSSPSGIDPREQSDFHLGSKLLYERREMMRRKMEQTDLLRAIELERRRFISLQLPEFKNSITPNHHRSFSVGSPGYFSSASNQSPEYQSELTGADVLEVDDTSELHPYPVINPMSVNSNYSNGAKEGTNKSEMLESDTGSTIELVLPSNLFPSASSTDDHKTDDSAETNAKVGISSTNGNDHGPPATANNLMH
ncbi:PREDICTED: zinc finger CCCH domain-containing protein 55-like isoform X2 [Camelina sativa]|uniref:Zinc finger CCCH domain-containing protein 55-like isoform X2 n=1 Tax=Camelina sativa TaxID=90675 RepID=A0ABM0T290_CAMSA|nr:PREDICTED: zinc finger CCCH domain-containing protein 55-like isoform X2 [Camelina sativa]